MKYKGEKFLVYGLKKSGTESAKYLLSVGAEVGLYDDDESVMQTEAVLSLVEKGAKIVDYINENEENYEERKNNLLYYSVVVVSPAVRIDSPLLVYLKRSGKMIIGELELAYLSVKSPVVAVSGTNGKTTVCNLIKKVLDVEGETSYLVGNVGTPAISVAKTATETDVLVTEVSSFQLETTDKFEPFIGVMLNVTEDHLDRHYSMDNYVYLKKKLFKNSTKFDTAVLNYDDEIIRSWDKDLKCKKVWFSIKEKVNGAYAADNKIYYNGEEILDVNDLSLKGEHNVQNALAAITALKLYGVSNRSIVRGLCDFQGVPMRLQKVCVSEGVTYINDSKSTNVDSTKKAIDYVDKPTVLIVGGKDKMQDFKSLFTAVKNCKDKIIHTVLIGETAEKALISAVNDGYYSVSVAKNLEKAVKIAKIHAEKGGIVLFSPGASSFDAYENYVARGEHFNLLVKISDEEE